MRWRGAGASEASAPRSVEADPGPAPKQRRVVGWPLWYRAAVMLVGAVAVAAMVVALEAFVVPAVLATRARVPPVRLPGGGVLVAVCTSGQISNRLQCAQKAAVLARLSQRRLVLPVLPRLAGGGGVDLAHYVDTRCFDETGDGLTWEAFAAELCGELGAAPVARGDGVAGVCADRATGAPFAVAAPAMLSLRNVYGRGCLGALRRRDLAEARAAMGLAAWRCATLPADLAGGHYSVAGFQAAMARHAAAQVLLVADTQGVRGLEVASELAPVLNGRPTCAIRPSVAVAAAARGAVDALLLPAPSPEGDDNFPLVAALHVRRGDWFEFAAGSSWQPLPSAARCAARALRDGAALQAGRATTQRAVFVATNGDVRERAALTASLIAAGATHVLTSEDLAAALPPRLAGDPIARAMADRAVASALSAHFVGTRGSTFSNTIIDLINGVSLAEAAAVGVEVNARDGGALLAHNANALCERGGGEGGVVAEPDCRPLLDLVDLRVTLDELTAPTPAPCGRVLPLARAPRRAVVLVRALSGRSGRVELAAAERFSRMYLGGDFVAVHAADPADAAAALASLAQCDSPPPAVYVSAAGAIARADTAAALAGAARDAFAAAGRPASAAPPLLVWLGEPEIERSMAWAFTYAGEGGDRHPQPLFGGGGPSAAELAHVDELLLAKADALIDGNGNGKGSTGGSQRSGAALRRAVALRAELGFASRRDGDATAGSACPSSAT